MGWIGFALAQGVLLLIVLVGLPLLATQQAKKLSNPAPAKGLNLPQGSVRSMLALTSVGSFVVVVAFGASALGDSFELVVTTMSAFAGPILGFYFGSRGSEPQNERANKRCDEGESA